LSGREQLLDEDEDRYRRHHTRLMIPATNSSAIKNQQQPRE